MSQIQVFWRIIAVLSCMLFLVLLNGPKRAFPSDFPGTQQRPEQVASQAPSPSVAPASHQNGCSGLVDEAKPSVASSSGHISSSSAVQAHANLAQEALEFRKQLFTGSGELEAVQPVDELLDYQKLQKTFDLNPLQPLTSLSSSQAPQAQEGKGNAGSIHPKTTDALIIHPDSVFLNLGSGSPLNSHPEGQSLWIEFSSDSAVEPHIYKLELPIKSEGKIKTTDTVVAAYELVKILRIPSGFNWKKRKILARDWVKTLLIADPRHPFTSLILKKTFQYKSIQREGIRALWHSMLYKRPSFLYVAPTAAGKSPLIYAELFLNMALWKHIAQIRMKNPAMQHQQQGMGFGSELRPLYFVIADSKDIVLQLEKGLLQMRNDPQFSLGLQKVLFGSSMAVPSERLPGLSTQNLKQIPNIDLQQFQFEFDLLRWGGVDWKDSSYKRKRSPHQTPSFEEFMRILEQENLGQEDNNTHAKPLVVVTTTKSLKSFLANAGLADGLAIGRGLNESEKLQRLRRHIASISYDEAHHSVASETIQVIEGLIKDSESFLFGTTATPEHYQRSLQSLYHYHAFWAYLDTSIDYIEREGSLYRDMNDVITQVTRAIQAGELPAFDRILMLSPQMFQDRGGPPFFIHNRNSRVVSKFEINPYYYKKLANYLRPFLLKHPQSFLSFATVPETIAMTKILQEVIPEKKIEFYVSDSSFSSHAVALNADQDSSVSGVFGIPGTPGIPGISGFYDLPERPDPSVYTNNRPRSPDDVVADLPGTPVTQRIQSDRKALERAINGETDILVTCRCLDEGVNNPRFSFYFDGNRSITARQFIQRSGRGMRITPGKEAVEVMVITDLNLSNVEDFIMLHNRTEELQKKYRTWQTGFKRPGKNKNNINNINNINSSDALIDDLENYQYDLQNLDLGDRSGRTAEEIIRERNQLLRNEKIHPVLDLIEELNRFTINRIEQGEMPRKPLYWDADERPLFDVMIKYWTLLKKPKLFERFVPELHPYLSTLNASTPEEMVEMVLAFIRNLENQGLPARRPDVRSNKLQESLLAKDLDQYQYQENFIKKIPEVYRSLFKVEKIKSPLGLVADKFNRFAEKLRSQGEALRRPIIWNLGEEELVMILDHFNEVFKDRTSHPDDVERRVRERAQFLSQIDSELSQILTSREVDGEEYFRNLYMNFTSYLSRRVADGYVWGFPFADPVYLEEPYHTAERELSDRLELVKSSPSFLVFLSKDVRGQWTSYFFNQTESIRLAQEINERFIQLIQKLDKTSEEVKEKDQQAVALILADQMTLLDVLKLKRNQFFRRTLHSRVRDHIFFQLALLWAKWMKDGYIDGIGLLEEEGGMNNESALRALIEAQHIINQQPPEFLNKIFSQQLNYSHLPESLQRLIEEYENEREFRNYASGDMNRLLTLRKRVKIRSARQNVKQRNRKLQSGTTSLLISNSTSASTLISTSISTTKKSISTPSTQDENSEAVNEAGNTDKSSSSRRKRKKED